MDDLRPSNIGAPAHLIKSPKLFSAVEAHETALMQNAGLMQILSQVERAAQAGHQNLSTELVVSAPDSGSLSVKEFFDIIDGLSALGYGAGLDPELEDLFNDPSAVFRRKGVSSLRIVLTVTWGNSSWVRRKF